MKLTNTIAALAIVAAPAAWAGSLGETPAEPMMEPMAEAEPAPHDWSGFYVGAFLGKTEGDYESYNNGSFLEEQPMSGSGAGAFVGYNFQRDNWVFGAELSVPAYDVALDVCSACVADNFKEVKARLGYSSGRILYYGFAGISDADFEFPGSSTSVGRGAVYGVGVEWAFSDHWLAGLELNRRTFDGVYDVNPAQTIDLRLNSAELRIGYHF